MIENGWYICDNCGRKLFKVTPGALAKGISIKCKGTAEKRCGKVLYITIKQGKEAPTA